MLLTALKENNLNENNVYAFKFNFEDNSLVDITAQIRRKIKTSKTNLHLFISSQQPPENTAFWLVPNGQRRIFSLLPKKQIGTVERRPASKGPIKISIASHSPKGTVIAEDIPMVQYANTAGEVDGNWSGLGTEQTTFTPTETSLNKGDFIVTYNISYSADSSLRYLVSKIKKVIKTNIRDTFLLTGRDNVNPTHVGETNKLFYFDTANAGDVQRLELEKALYRGIHPSQKDALYTARSFTHAGWVGPLLYHYELGNGTDIYDIPISKYGYKVVHIDNIKLMNTMTEIVPLEIEFKREGILHIKLPMKFHNTKSHLDSDDIRTKCIRFSLRLSSTQFDYSEDGIQEITKTEILSAKGDGKSREITPSPASGKISSIPICSEGGNIAYVDGKATKLENILNYPFPVIKLVFREAPPKDSLITFPVSVGYSPNVKDSFMVEFDGYQ
jgi:hypothetical protein